MPRVVDGSGLVERQDASGELVVEQGTGLLGEPVAPLAFGQTLDPVQDLGHRNRGGEDESGFDAVEPVDHRPVRCRAHQLGQDVRVEDDQSSRSAARDA